MDIHLHIRRPMGLPRSPMGLPQNPTDPHPNPTTPLHLIILLHQRHTIPTHRRLLITTRAPPLYQCHTQSNQCPFQCTPQSSLHPSHSNPPPCQCILQSSPMERPLIPRSHTTLRTPTMNPNTILMDLQTTPSVTQSMMSTPVKTFLIPKSGTGTPPLESTVWLYPTAEFKL